MPRELIHWAVIDQAKKRLSERAPKLHRALGDYRPFHRLGSVAQDAPYYLRSGRTEFVATARLLHGHKGEDTLQPLRLVANQLRSLPEGDRVRLTVFLAGMASHVAADSRFHPFVYYFTGNYYDPDPQKKKQARARHRLLEVYLDSWCESVHPTQGSALLKTHKDKFGVSDSALLGRVLSEICRSASLPADSKIAGYEDCWVQSFSWLTFGQRLFRSPLCGAGMRALKQVFPKALLELDSLFAFGRNADKYFESEIFEYRNPLSGESVRIKLSELLELAVEDTVQLLLELEPLVSGEDLAVNLWPTKVGPSLSFGVVGGKNEDAQYFSEVGLPIRGLEIKS